MTDANQALLIGLVATIITGVVIPIVTHMLNARKFADQNREIALVKDDVHKVEVATNSMKDQLVAATRVAAHSEGMQQEQLDQRAREAEQAKGASQALGQTGSIAGSAVVEAKIVVPKKPGPDGGPAEAKIVVPKG